MGMLVIPTVNNSDKYKGDKREHVYAMRNYTNPQAVKFVIDDIFRTRINEKYRDQLLAYGGIGVNYKLPVEYIIKSFEYVQNVYDIDKRKGRRMYHEIFWFSQDELLRLNRNVQRMWNFAEECARVAYYEKGFMVLFAIHTDNEYKCHIHFAVNTINYMDGHKLRTYRYDLKERNIMFNQILQKYLNMEQIPLVPVFFGNRQVYMK